MVGGALEMGGRLSAVEIETVEFGFLAGCLGLEKFPLLSLIRNSFAFTRNSLSFRIGEKSILFLV